MIAVWSICVAYVWKSQRRTSQTRLPKVRNVPIVVWRSNQLYNVTSYPLFVLRLSYVETSFMHSCSLMLTWDLEYIAKVIKYVSSRREAYCLAALEGLTTCNTVMATAVVAYTVPGYPCSRLQDEMTKLWLVQCNTSNALRRPAILRHQSNAERNPLMACNSPSHLVDLLPLEIYGIKWKYCVTQFPICSRVQLVSPVSVGSGRNQLDSRVF